jgi:GrpB-like predicted nucleotidyltransferase (UPF0157 family)
MISMAARLEPGMDDLDPRWGLGLEWGSNRLAEHNPLWAEAFEHEAARLRTVLGPRALAIEHYGSTSVPGLRAKPILDLQIGVARIDDVHGFIEPMARLGYDDAGSQGIADHHIFGRGAARTHIAHVAIYESEAWFGCLRFRDRLRADPTLRAEYERLKISLSASGLTRGDYGAGKAAFIERMSAP